MAALPAILVTGASSGIGLATAQLLSKSGYRVFAGVRTLSDRSIQENLSEIELDVSDEASIRAAVQKMEHELEGAGLAGLINNAGIADVAPIEFHPVRNFRAVFEVNVFGLVAVTQAFLPLLHRAQGRIVNMGSIGGLITIPFGATLCASKHAVEAISDCMRLELYPAGIHVTCLQPASINSGSAEKLAAKNEQTIASLSPEGQRRYADMLRRFMKVTMESETKGSPPSLVAHAVLDVLRSEAPPARKLVGKDHLLLKLAAKALPDSIRDRLFRRLFFGSPSFGSCPASQDQETEHHSDLSVRPSASKD
ncbi:short-chain dehydrogenase [Terrimicrobium sacchariphilum]|uniref:Short-chain dehydrogenase n=1 Tax=Terrimicrobium sacchariphilum TaxID=690879 RepID=A0A146G8L5_TERSA|nr:SDR family oxidoreductase [Terrimicrobium sacchariphilum]GAT34049.1 short-chain dehydrogenase [Terrimicrobium sacchariphilum]